MASNTSTVTATSDAPATPEDRHEVWYTDNAGHRRYQNALGGADEAQEVATGFHREGFTDVEIHKVVETKTQVEFTPPAPMLPAPELVDVPQVDAPVESVAVTTPSVTVTNE